MKRANAPTRLEVCTFNGWETLYLQTGQPPGEWRRKAVYLPSKAQRALGARNGWHRTVVLLTVED